LDANRIMPAAKPSRGFYWNYGKRLFDLFFAVTGLLLLSPLFILIAVAIKLRSTGPVFYAQERVGKAGNVFRVLKFRSMVPGADQIGPDITSAGDSRVTPVGRYLRKWKLDELPQLWNVLKGEMSMVGPRPESPSYVRNYTPEQREVLSVRPGITDLAAIQYRHEEQILASSNDVAQFYIEVVLPHKLSLNRLYIEKLSLFLDVKLILQTLKVIPASGEAKNAAADRSSVCGNSTPEQWENLHKDLDKT